MSKRKRHQTLVEMALLNVLVFVTLVALQITPYIEAVTTCYFGSWATYRPGSGKFEVENINVNLCTHIIYSFIGINQDATIKILDPELDVNKKGFLRFTGLKNKKRGLKALVAIGGWNQGSTTFSSAFSTQASRKKFIQNAIAFIKKYKFDGLDLDWEYPAKRGGSPNDKKNFADLCKEMRAEFNKNKFLLTAAVSANPAPESYDVPAISKSLHFIHVMTYDYHGGHDGKTGHNAPLYGGSSDPDNNVNASINAWIKSKADRKKLVLGIPTYGVTYTLQSSSNNGVGAPTKGPGLKGPFTQQDGMLGYNEICLKFREGGWTRKQIPGQAVPYAYKGDQWIGYDDVASVTRKAKYAKQMRLVGTMIWSIETDDFRGSCGPKYPLLTAIKQNSP